VRSEAAVGKILECPKCQSMVQITPPPGWMPAAAVAALQTPTPGPPPLERVATDSLVLDLEPGGGWWLGSIVGGHAWLLGGAALTCVTLTVCVLGWRWMEGAQTKAVSAASDSTAKERANERSLRPEPLSDAAAPQTPATTPLTKAPAALPVAPRAARATKSNPPMVKSGVKSLTKEAKTDGKDDAGQGAKQSEKKAPPAPVDVAARTADSLPGIELTEVPLTRAVDLLSAVSTLPITLDPDAMRQLGVSPRDRISLRLDSTTIGRALQAVAAKRGLAATSDNGQVILTLPAEHRESLHTVPYTVSDLTGDNKAAMAEFAALLKEFVAPESWREVGGRGTIEPKDRVLMVTQTRDVHWQVLVFCEKLRNARKKPLRSHDRPERFTLATRTGQARAMLDRAVAVNFHEPAPLSKILNFLAHATDSDILIDHASLAAAETSDRVETSLTVRNRPLGAVLDELLRPLGLAYRVIGPDAIQVTSTEAAEERLEVEFYPVGRRLNGATTAAKLIQRLKTEVAPPSWSDVGGSGEVDFDEPSQCLIVLQSQAVQAAVERMIASKHESRGK
jgi:hypothetical protein